MAIEQERRQYNARFNVRRCAYRGLNEIAFRVSVIIFILIPISMNIILAHLVSDLRNQKIAGNIAG